MPAVRAVIDTNIWVSSLLNPFGFPARLRKSFEEGSFHVIISAPMIEELADVLNRPRIKGKFEIAKKISLVSCLSLKIVQKMFLFQAALISAGIRMTILSSRLQSRDEQNILSQETTILSLINKYHHICHSTESLSFPCQNS